MNAPILVTGGTGTLGRLVVSRLRDAGRDVRVLSRRSHGDENGIRYMTGDLTTGAGTEPAVDGVAAIVHCASSLRGDAGATRNLVQAITARAGTPHLVYISIVGVDRVTFGYYRSKFEAEGVVAGSGLPWTTLRATQFYDLILMAARKAALLPLVPVPSGFLVQPVDADEVAARLVELTLGEPAGRAPDLGGPQVSSAADLIRAYLRARHRRQPVVPVWLPATRKIRAGALLPGQQDPPQHPASSRTWEQFLADRLN